MTSKQNQIQQSQVKAAKRQSFIAKIIWRSIAVASLVLGVIGAFLPIMPTVPFILVAAWAASQGWEELDNWLINHPKYGEHVRQWRERGAVPRRAKWASTIMMTISAIGLQFMQTIPLWARITTALVMLCVGIYIWRRPE